MKKLSVSRLARAEADHSFEVVYLFSLLGLLVTLAFARLIAG
jgi:hypothetical protein